MCTRLQPGLALTNSLTEQRFSVRTAYVRDFPRRGGSRSSPLNAAFTSTHTHTSHEVERENTLDVLRRVRSKIRDRVSTERKERATQRAAGYLPLPPSPACGEEKIRQFAILTSVLNIVAALYPGEINDRCEARRSFIARRS